MSRAALPFIPPPRRAQTEPLLETSSQQWLQDRVKQAKTDLIALRESNDRSDEVNASLQRSLDTAKKTLAVLRELRLSGQRQHTEHVAWMAAYRAGALPRPECFGCGKPATTMHDTKAVCATCSQLTGLELREARMAAIDREAKR